jgi:long-chain fatty acid transport protein
MKKHLLAAACAAALAPGAALATDGYFSHGYGMKAKGRGGASTAMTTDAFGGATNPATMVYAGSRTEFGVDVFAPDRSASRVGSAGGAGFLDGAADGNEAGPFLIPEFAYNRLIRPDVSLGVTVYGNGGMNTEYASGQLDQGVCMGGAPKRRAGQPPVRPGQARRGHDAAHHRAHSGAQVHQRPRARHLAAHRLPALQGLRPAALRRDLLRSGQPYEQRLRRLLGCRHPLRLLRRAHARVRDRRRVLDEDRHAGVRQVPGSLRRAGRLRHPGELQRRRRFKATPKLTIAGDYQRINYSDIPSVGNPSNVPGVGAAQLGASSSSIGFGWDDVNVFKIGLEYQWSPKMLLRAGYNVTDNPIQARDVTFNILAPGVVTDHLTLGFTYSMGGGSELTMAYMHAFENSVSGPANNPNFPVGGTETIEMSQNSLGIAWSWKY